MRKKKTPQEPDRRPVVTLEVIADHTGTLAEGTLLLFYPDSEMHAFDVPPDSRAVSLRNVGVFNAIKKATWWQRFLDFVFRREW